VAEQDAPRSDVDREPRVREIMRTDVPTLAPEESVAVVAQRIVDSGLPGLPVVEGGEIVGIVGETDLLMRYADVSPPGFAAFFDWVIRADVGQDYDEEIRRVAGLTARDLMTHPVYSIRESATLGQIATLMVDRRVNPVPVLDATGNLVGIVARADLVRLIARLEAGDVASDADSIATIASGDATTT
jgi:CBS domain-containing protein